ncbi:hypothetical protein PRIPAC_85829, partial [Pristionchus pacificus]
AMSTDAVVLRWEVEGVAELTTSDKHLPAQMLNDMPWTLNVKKQTTNNAENLALYLHCNTDCVYDHWTCKHESKLVLVNRNDTANNVTAEVTKDYNQGNTNWGKNDVFLYTDLVDANRGFILDNKIILEAHIIVKETQGLKKVVHYDFKQDNGGDNVALTVEDEKLFVSRGFLTVESPFFADLFNKEFEPREPADYDLKLVKVDDFIAFLNATYPSNKAITADTYKVVLALAETFQVQRAIDKVEHYLIKTKKLTVAAKLVLSEKHNMEQLQLDAIHTLMKPEEVKALEKTDEYKEFSDDLKVVLLSRIFALI